jgi:hypothetical protein
MAPDPVCLVPERLTSLLATLSTKIANNSRAIQMNSSKQGIEVKKDPAAPVCYRMPED